ncbi:MAG: translocation/assembly module TamB domain-containing protein, partial [Deltaproteobacteria bacterium]|nr:translocation/assembly module TamB domain-containing protein [Nannocystaceae bacterium]
VTQPAASGTRATLRGTVALQAVRALLAPYGLEAGKGRIDIDFALDGPIAAPKLSGRLDLPRDQHSLVLDFAAVPFPIELTDLSLGVNDEWIAARAVVRVLGEDIEVGSVGGARTGYAFGGECAGHFDAAARGTASVRLLSQLLGDAVEGSEGAIDIPQAIVSGSLIPELNIQRAEGSIGFTDHQLTLRVTDGLDALKLRKGRVVFARCGPSHPCTDVGVDDGSLAFYVGGERGAPRERKPVGAIEAEIGTRGRAAVWGRLFIAPDGTPLHTELDVSIDDVSYRHYDARGRPVAEGEINSDLVALRGSDPIVVQGELALARSRYVKDAVQGSDILALTDDGGGVPTSQPSELVRSLQFDLRVATDDPLRVDNNIATGIEANAQVAVTGDYDTPEFAGRIDFESGGRIDIPFLTGTYAIQRGRVNLLGEINDAEVDVLALREEPVYVKGNPQQLKLALAGTLSEIHWTCLTDGDNGGQGESARSCFDYLVLGTGDVDVSDADVRRFGGGGIGEARKPLQVVGHVTEFDIDERAVKAVPRLRGYIPDANLRLGPIGPELQIATPANWFDFDYLRASVAWDYTRGYPGFFLRQSRQITFRLELLEPITLEFSRRIRSYLNQRVVFDPLNQRTIELRFDVTVPSAR